MLRVLLDTNVYGFIVKEKFPLDSLKRTYIIYGYSIVRKELRKIRTTTEHARRFRIAALSAYDQLTSHHTLPHSAAIEKRARTLPLEGNDACILACALEHELVLCTNDNALLHARVPGITTLSYSQLKKLSLS